MLRRDPSMTGRHILATAVFLALGLAPMAQAKPHNNHGHHGATGDRGAADNLGTSGALSAAESPGTVVSAPEIDRGRASSALALLVGALALLHETRRR